MWKHPLLGAVVASAAVLYSAAALADGSSPTYTSGATLAADGAYTLGTWSSGTGTTYWETRLVDSSDNVLWYSRNQNTYGTALVNVGTMYLEARGNDDNGYNTGDSTVGESADGWYRLTSAVTTSEDFADTDVDAQAFANALAGGSKVMLDSMSDSVNDYLYDTGLDTLRIEYAYPTFFSSRDSSDDAPGHDRSIPPSAGQLALIGEGWENNSRIRAVIVDIESYTDEAGYTIEDKLKDTLDALKAACPTKQIGWYTGYGDPGYGLANDDEKLTGMQDRITAGSYDSADFLTVDYYIRQGSGMSSDVDKYRYWADFMLWNLTRTGKPLLPILTMQDVEQTQTAGPPFPDNYVLASDDHLVVMRELAMKYGVGWTVWQTTNSWTGPLTSPATWESYLTTLPAEDVTPYETLLARTLEIGVISATATPDLETWIEANTPHNATRLDYSGLVQTDIDSFDLLVIDRNVPNNILFLDGQRMPVIICSATAGDDLDVASGTGEDVYTGATYTPTLKLATPALFDGVSVDDPIDSGGLGLHDEAYNDVSADAEILVECSNDSTRKMVVAYRAGNDRTTGQVFAGNRVLFPSYSGDTEVDPATQWGVEIQDAFKLALYWVVDPAAFELGPAVDRLTPKRHNYQTRRER